MNLHYSAPFFTELSISKHYLIKFKKHIIYKSLYLKIKKIIIKFIEFFICLYFILILLFECDKYFGHILIKPHSDVYIL